MDCPVDMDFGFCGSCDAGTTAHLSSLKISVVLYVIEITTMVAPTYLIIIGSTEVFMGADKYTPYGYFKYI